MSLFSDLVGIFLGDEVAKYAGEFASTAVGAGYGKKSSKTESFINRIEEVSPNFGAQPVSRFGYPRQDTRRFTQGLASIGNSESLFDKYRQMILENARRTTTFVPVLVQPVPVDDTKIKAQPRWRPSQRA